jgi:hypothetical protein
MNIANEDFVPYKSLGAIIVPYDYRHEVCLASFRFRHGDQALGDDMLDKNFATPSRILKPGDQLHAQVYRQLHGCSSFEERVAFLQLQPGNQFVGIQGAVLALEQKHFLWEKECYMYMSVDEPERLYRDKNGRQEIHVPLACVTSRGLGLMSLIGGDGDSSIGLLGFSDVL